MKRLFSMVPMLLLCVCALTACGGNDDDDDKITEGKNGEYVTQVSDLDFKPFEHMP